MDTNNKINIKVNDAKVNDTKVNNTKVNGIIRRCIYDEICSKNKMCGDCCMDKYERERYEEDYENYKLDLKMN
jgi:hypothetical protein